MSNYCGYQLNSIEELINTAENRHCPFHLLDALGLAGLGGMQCKSKHPDNDYIYCTLLQRSKRKEIKNCWKHFLAKIDRKDWLDYDPEMHYQKIIDGEEE